MRDLGSRQRGALCVLLAVSVGTAFAQGRSGSVSGDPRASPGVQWGTQVIRAVGAGAPDLKAATPAQARLGAERAALADALRNLLAQVKGTTVDGQRRIADLMEKDEIRLKVEGIVRGYRVVGKRYFSDGGVEVDIEVPISTLVDVFDPDPTPAPLAQAPVAVGAAPVAAGASPADGGRQAAVGPPPPTPPLEATPATGLVIDARGLKVVPALSPKVLDDAGRAVYSVDSLSASARKSGGVAAYVESLDEATKSLKAGDRPLVVKAAKSAGADLYLPAETVARLASVPPAALAEGRVVIVTTSRLSP